MKYFITALQKYAVFEGRARRAEYWYFELFTILIALGLGLLEGLLGIAPHSDNSILATIFQLIILLPSIGVSIRRMHDVNKSGWYILIPIYSLILALTPGDSGDNRYGSDPILDENSDTDYYNNTVNE